MVGNLLNLRDEKLHLAAGGLRIDPAHGQRNFRVKSSLVPWERLLRGDLAGRSKRFQATWNVPELQPNVTQLVQQREASRIVRRQAAEGMLQIAGGILHISARHRRLRDGDGVRVSTSPQARQGKVVHETACNVVRRSALAAPHKFFQDLRSSKVEGASFPPEQVGVYR